MGTEEYTPLDLQQSNLTAAHNYKHQGPGVGAGSGALEYVERAINFRLSERTRVLEIGAGAGEFLVACATRGATAYGVDIAEACVKHINTVVHKTPLRKKIAVLTQDISHEPLAVDDNSFDLAACTETIEHLSNPYHMVAEVKRTLVHDGLFVVAYPQPDRNLGYGGGQHAHIYPGFLKKESFELFMRQLYFKRLHGYENGSSDWSIWANYKGPGVVDAFAMGSGNYDERELYAPLDNWTSKWS